MPGAAGADVFRFVSAHVPRKTHETLLFLFFPRNPHSVGINHDHEIAGVDMRSKNGLFFAAQQVRCFDRNPAEDLILGVNKPPLAVDFVGLSGKSFHQRLKKRSEEHTSELQSRRDLVCRLLLEKKKRKKKISDA